MVWALLITCVAFPMAAMSTFLRGPVIDPRVDEFCLNGPVNDPRGDAGGLVIDPCNHILATVPQGSSEDSPFALKKLIVVLSISLSFKSFWNGIGCMQKI